MDIKVNRCLSCINAVCFHASVFSNIVSSLLVCHQAPQSESGSILHPCPLSVICSLIVCVSLVVVSVTKYQVMIILFSHHTSSQCCKARRFRPGYPSHFQVSNRTFQIVLERIPVDLKRLAFSFSVALTWKWLGQPGRNVVLCNTDCWCDEKKVLAMNTQQEPTLKSGNEFAGLG